jgi:hypothetical protein
MTDPTTIEEAIARLKAARTGPELEALAQLGGREQNRWGSFALTAPRRLGEWLNRTPRLKGRPKKESIVDSLPSLADLGITDRRLAAWALKVAAVPKGVFDRYLRSAETVTRAGLLAYSAEAAPRAFAKTTDRDARAHSAVKTALLERELRVLQGDCAVRLRKLDSGSVDLIDVYRKAKRGAVYLLSPDVERSTSTKGL